MLQMRQGEKDTENLYKKAQQPHLFFLLVI